MDLKASTDPASLYVWVGYETETRQMLSERLVFWWNNQQTSISRADGASRRIGLFDYGRKDNHDHFDHYLNHNYLTRLFLNFGNAF